MSDSTHARNADKDGALECGFAHEGCIVYRAMDVLFFSRTRYEAIQMADRRWCVCRQQCAGLVRSQRDVECTWAQWCTVRTSHAVPAPFRRASAYVFLNRQFNRDTEGPAKASGLRRVNSCLIVGRICLTIEPIKLNWSTPR